MRKKESGSLRSVFIRNVKWVFAVLGDMGARMIKKRN